MKLFVLIFVLWLMPDRSNPNELLAGLTLHGQIQLYQNSEILSIPLLANFVDDQDPDDSFFAEAILFNLPTYRDAFKLWNMGKYEFPFTLIVSINPSLIDLPPPIPFLW